MALLDFDQPYQYLVPGDPELSAAKAAAGGWSVGGYGGYAGVVTTYAPRPKTAMFYVSAWKVFGSDGSLAVGDAGCIAGARYVWITGQSTGFQCVLQNGNPQISVASNSDGTLSVKRGYPWLYPSTLLDTSVFAMATGQCYYIELDVLLHKTAGWYKVYVDNVLRIDSAVNYPSGLDTCQQTTATWNGLSYITHYYFQQDGPYATDFYACDHRDGTTLTPPQLQAFNTPLGDVRVNYRSALAGNGTYTDWAITGAADRGEALDDTEDGAAIDGDATYVSDSVSGNRVSAALDDLDAGSTDILCVAPVAAMTKDGGGSKEVYLGYHISGGGANPYMGDAIQVPAQGSYGVRRELLTASPATGVAWTRTEFNAAEGVVEIV
jgi:hypothetical protein